MEEITIKVPAPFSGVSDLGFTARYPSQPGYAASADVPLPQASASPPAGAVRSTPRVLPSPRTSSAPAARRPAAFPIDLATLNRDQAALERAEAAVVTELIRSARAYLEGVVVPAVRRAERVSMVIAPATMQRPAAIRKRL